MTSMRRWEVEVPAHDVTGQPTGIDPDRRAPTSSPRYPVPAATLTVMAATPEDAKVMAARILHRRVPVPAYRSYLAQTASVARAHLARLTASEEREEALRQMARRGR